MPDCPACATAERNPRTGLAIDGCLQCTARRLSLAPMSHRQAVYAATSDEDRGELIARVGAEYARRMALLLAG